LTIEILIAEAIGKYLASDTFKIIMKEIENRILRLRNELV